MVTSRARERRNQEDYHIGPWLEGKGRGKTEIRFEETLFFVTNLKKLEPSAKETSCCDDDDYGVKLSKGHDDESISPEGGSRHGGRGLDRLVGPCLSTIPRIRSCSCAAVFGGDLN